MAWQQTYIYWASYMSTIKTNNDVTEELHQEVQQENGQHERLLQAKP
jgi:hypothetical protein